MRDLKGSKLVVVVLLGVLSLLAAPMGLAQDEPHYGGDLTFLVPSEPPSYTLHQHRIIPHSSKVKGWTVTPSHVLNNQLDTVWSIE